jgi:hypothetical protein
MHTLSDWFNNHFLTWYKPISILFTGAFGILGLVKNFKEKTFDPATGFEVERITKWGSISMIGIILSTGLGIAAQRTEENRNQKKANDDANAALALATKSDQTLDKIERLLSPTIEGIQFSTRYDLPCKKFDWDCKDLRKRIKADPSARLAEVNHQWGFIVQFFVNSKDAESFIAGKKDVEPDLEYNRLSNCVIANENEEDPNSDILMACEDSEPGSNPSVNNGNVTDAIIMQRSVCLVHIDTWGGIYLSEGTMGAQVLNLKFWATLKDNRRFEMTFDQKGVTTRKGTVYMGSFKPAEATSHSTEPSAAPNPGTPNPAKE